MKKFTTILMILLTMLIMSCDVPSDNEGGGGTPGEAWVPTGIVSADLINDVIECLNIEGYLDGEDDITLIGNIEEGLSTPSIYDLFNLPTALIQFEPPDTITITGLGCTIIVIVDLETFEWTDDGGCPLELVVTVATP